MYALYFILFITVGSVHDLGVKEFNQINNSVIFV